MTLTEDIDLYEGYRRMVYRIMIDHFKIEPRRDLDMVQVGMVGLVKARNSFNPELGNKFSTYAWRAIRFAIMAELKQREKLSRIVPDELFGDELELGVVDEFEKPAKIDWDFIEANLTDVRAVYVLWMRYVGSRTLQEIGRRLNISKERVRQIEREALIELRQVYPREGRNAYGQHHPHRSYADKVFLQALRELRQAEARPEGDLPLLSARQERPQSQRRARPSRPLRRLAASGCR